MFQPDHLYTLLLHLARLWPFIQHVLILLISLLLAMSLPIALHLALPLASLHQG